MPKDSKSEKGKTVDLSAFKLTTKEVSVNGKKLPLAVGDQILINEQDNLVKTVVCIQIYEDERVGYMLEWFDSSDSSFKTEWVTSAELAFLNRAKKERKMIKAFGAAD